MGQLPQLLNRLLHFARQLVEHLRPGCGIVRDDVAGQPQVDGQGHQVLLGAVVEVALDPPALGVAAGHNAGPGLPQCVGLLAAARRGWSGAPCRAASCGRPSPTWRARSVSTRSSSSENRSSPAARSTTTSPSNSPPWLMGATRSWACARPSRRAGSHTDAQALPDTPARVTTGRSRASTTRDRRPGVGNRHRPLQHLAHPGVHLGADQPHGLAQRLGQLEEQLVHGDGPGQPASEGAQHLVGRLPGAVDEPGGRAQKAGPGRHEGDRGDGGGQQGESQDRPLRRVVRLVTQAEHHHQIDGRHQGDEPEQRERSHEHASALGRQPGAPPRS